MFHPIFSRIAIPFILTMILVSCGMNPSKNIPTVSNGAIPPTMAVVATWVATVPPPNMQDIMNNPPCESKSTLVLQQQCFVDRAVSRNDVFICENIKDVDKQILCRDTVVINNARTREDCKMASDMNIQKDCEKILK